MYNVVYTSGTFDLFHSNHVEMINYARGIGKLLIVGVSTDELVATYKDPPIIPFDERISVVRAMAAPNVVVPQHSLDHVDLLEKLSIDCFVVGDDWTGRYDYLKEHKCDVFYFPYGRGASTTKIKQKVAEQYANLRKTVDRHGNPDPRT